MCLYFVTRKSLSCNTWGAVTCTWMWLDGMPDYNQAYCAVVQCQLRGLNLLNFPARSALYCLLLLLSLRYTWWLMLTTEYLQTASTDHWAWYTCWFIRCTYFDTGAPGGRRPLPRQIWSGSGVCIRSSDPGTSKIEQGLHCPELHLW